MLTDSIVVGACTGIIFFFIGDWRNVPYRGLLLKESANTSDRWRVTIFLFVLCLVIYVPIHLIVPRKTHISAIWVILFVTTTIITNFTKPLTRLENNHGQSSKSS